MFDAKTKSELTTEIEVDPLLIKAVEEDPCFGDTQSICQPEFGIVTVPGMVCNEVSIGSRRYRESFLAVIAHTLRSPLVAPLIYHPNFIKAKASMAGFDITRRFNVL